MPWEPRTVKSFEDFVAQWLCMPKAVAWVLLVLCAAGTVCGQGAAAAAPVQTQTDEYTRYELLSTESSSFAIRYEVTATTAGAFNPIRKGSVASGIRSMHRFEVDGYVLHSGRPYSLWFCFLGYPTGLLNDFVVRRGRDSRPPCAPWFSMWK